MPIENPHTSRTPRLTTSPTQPLHGRQSMGSGSITGRFFLAGEEQEATSYENVVVEDLSRASLASEFRSFDKVPKRRAPLVATLASLTLFVMLFVNWNDIRWLRNQPITLKLVYEAALASLPLRPQVEKPMTLPDPPPTPPTLAKPAVPIGPKRSLPDVVVKPIEVAPEANTQAVPEIVPNPPIKTTAMLEITPYAKAPPRRIRTQALRGYLWSPSANNLVPAVGAAADYKPSAVPGPEPRPTVPDHLPRPP